MGHKHDPVLDPTRTAAAGGVVRASRPAAVVVIGEGDLAGWITTRLRCDGCGVPKPDQVHVVFGGQRRGDAPG
jgi:hypothetical protein